VIVSALVLPAVVGRAEPGVDAPGSAASPPQGRQPLDFGDVVAGIELSVSRLDGRRAGSWKLFGREDQEVLLTFNLPAALAGPRGAALPIRFGREDGGFTTEHRPDQARGFDPQVPYLGRLGRGGHAYVFLGGTVSPPLGQRAGTYQGTVTLTVAFTAN
jgi:hypothetical protein